MAVDAYDVLTTTEGRQILGYASTDTTKDSTIERLVTAVSRRMDRLIGPVVQRAVTAEEIHAGCSPHIELSHGPVSAVSSVVEYQGTSAVTLTAETPGVQPTEAYRAERYAPNPALLSGILVRRCSGSTRHWWPEASVVVTYTAGRVASTTQVDQRHKEAAGLMLKNLWRSYEHSIGEVDQYDVPSASFPTFAVPNAVKELLNDELQTDDGFGA